MEETVADNVLERSASASARIPCPERKRQTSKGRHQKDTPGTFTIPPAPPNLPAIILAGLERSPAMRRCAVWASSPEKPLVLAAPCQLWPGGVALFLGSLAVAARLSSGSPVHAPLLPTSPSPILGDALSLPALARASRASGRPYNRSASSRMPDLIRMLGHQRQSPDRAMPSKSQRPQCSRIITQTTEMNDLT